jgi:hypothetical protein
MGTLQAEQVRGKEVFSFIYAKEWPETGPALSLDIARQEGRKSRPLMESDYLLGVFHLHRYLSLITLIKQNKLGIKIF